MSLPYNDDNMKYDITKGQYILTKNCVLNNLYLDESIETMLQTNPKVNQFLEEVSDDVYLYIFRYTRRDMKSIKRYLMAKREDLRDIIKRAMLYQARYALRSGAIAIKDMHGVDIEKTKSLNISVLRGEVGLAEQARQVLSDGGLLYTGRLYLTDKDLDDGSY